MRDDKIKPLSHSFIISVVEYNTIQTFKIMTKCIKHTAIYPLQEKSYSIKLMFPCYKTVLPHSMVGLLPGASHHHLYHADCLKSADLPLSLVSSTEWTYPLCCLSVACISSLIYKQVCCCLIEWRGEMGLHKIAALLVVVLLVGY